MPGDPASMLIDPKWPREAKEILRKQYGLDKPIYIQFCIYLKNITRGDFGKSFYYGEEVFKIILQKLPNTILLFTTSTLLSFILGFYLGKIIAWERNAKYENILTFFSLFFYSVFIPWFGLLMIWIFSYKLNLFPIGGLLTPEIFLSKDTPIFIKILNILHHLFLPVFVLTLMNFAGSMLLVRSSMLEVLKEDYIISAYAKGLKENVIRDRHAARNALLPVITAFTLSLSSSLSGGVLTEVVFSYPGLGRELVSATLNYDYPLAQAAFIFLSFVVLFANLIADILYAYLDPRVRY
jgi:peptide/nickel transport system permease protein